MDTFAFVHFVESDAVKNAIRLHDNTTPFNDNKIRVSLLQVENTIECTIAQVPSMKTKLKSFFFRLKNRMRLFDSHLTFR